MAACFLPQFLVLGAAPRGNANKSRAFRLADFFHAITRCDSAALFSAGFTMRNTRPSFCAGKSSNGPRYASPVLSSGELLKNFHSTAPSKSFELKANLCVSCFLRFADPERDRARNYLLP
jgi:hypothetical protein